MDDEIRYKAAAAVLALANRTESAGRRSAHAAKGKPWVDMPYKAHRKINPAKLHEAVRYYEIAESISREAAGWGYPRGLLLESMGAWDEAIAVFQSLAGTVYAQVGEAAAQRCADKRAGNFDGFADLEPSPELLRLMNLDRDEVDEELDAAIDAKLARHTPAQGKNKRSKRCSGADHGDDDSTRELAANTALTFVNHLLDRDYRAAHTMLHPWDAGIPPQVLKDEFETMFESEQFPESARVFDVQTDPSLIEGDDIAWVYVVIDSENNEAVSLRVAREKRRVAVRGVEFGRP